MPVKSWLAVWLKGPIAFVDAGDSTACSRWKGPATLECYEFDEHHSISAWWLPVALALSIVVSVLLERCLESPMRRFLRA